MLAAHTVLQGRLEVENILKGYDDRLLVVRCVGSRRLVPVQLTPISPQVVGPCSVHNTEAAMEYAKLLKAYADTAREDLLIVMRVYFEKVRKSLLIVASVLLWAAQDNRRLEGKSKRRV